MICLSTATLQAATGLGQEPSTIEGNISSVHSPQVSEANRLPGFDVNGVPIIVPLSSRFPAAHATVDKNVAALKFLLKGATCVRVQGVMRDGSMVADSIAFCPDTHKKASGLGVIDKVISTAPELVLQADGYRIRVPADAESAYSGHGKTAQDIKPGAWVRFTGKLDAAGVLVASNVEFLSPKLAAIKSEEAIPVREEPVTERPRKAPDPNIVNDNGALGYMAGKVKFDASSGWRRLTGDPSMQERVQRVGLRVTPDYQKQLSQDDPMKIRFRFFVIEEKWIRSCISGKRGIIFVPRPVMDRLAGDDRLAAILADGVASQLQAQRADMVSNKNFEHIAETAGVAIAVAAVSYAAGGFAAGAIVHEQELKLEEERSRVSLGLLVDSGYDPWQAPEAWRLLEPRHAPKDLEKVKYPWRGERELRMLAVEYLAGGASSEGPAAANTTTNPD
ncbi:MAG TPA: DUF5666 domain-containing protein [Terracidiphilus sp.]